MATTIFFSALFWFFFLFFLGGRSRGREDSYWQLDVGRWFSLEETAKNCLMIMSYRFPRNGNWTLTGTRSWSNHSSWATVESTLVNGEQLLLIRTHCLQLGSLTNLLWKEPATVTCALMDRLHSWLPRQLVISRFRNSLGWNRVEKSSYACLCTYLISGYKNFNVTFSLAVAKN